MKVNVVLFLYTELMSGQYVPGEKTRYLWSKYFASNYLAVDKAINTRHMS